MQFEGAEIIIYTTEGQNISISFSQLETSVMLKAIGFILNNDGSCNIFNSKTLKSILNGEVNPFKLKSLDDE